ncbi:MAG: hypothetical protein WC979_03440 [Candidatus Pacearchaeota archaeon]|jgi:hypothetical protein
MQIIGFNLTKISIERKEKVGGNLQINQSIDIKDVVKEKVPISQEEALKMKFQFSINYQEDLAKAEFEGNLILLPTKEELKDFLREWKDKKVPSEVRIPLFNFIMNKCNIKALALEDELNLPFHIPLPKVNPENKPENQK